jgi:hypothetical protein
MHKTAWSFTMNRTTSYQLQLQSQLQLVNQISTTHIEMRNFDEAKLHSKSSFNYVVFDKIQV